MFKTPLAELVGAATTFAPQTKEEEQSLVPEFVRVLLAYLSQEGKEREGKREQKRRRREERWRKKGREECKGKKWKGREREGRKRKAKAKGN